MNAFGLSNTYACLFSYVTMIIYLQETSGDVV